MREIKFRAKSLDTKEWVYGELHLRARHPHIHPDDAPLRSIYIDVNTIGEFTGLYDRKGCSIYEGDILRWGLNGVESETKIEQVVEFRNGAFGYASELGDFIAYAGNNNFDFFLKGTDKRFEIVGNIYEYPLKTNEHLQR